MSSILLSLIFLGAGPLTQAEGSRELLASQGERAYLEFSDDVTADINHQAVIKVFVKAGEQIHLGSSVPESANDPADIVYRSPQGGQDGSCDVQTSGAGLIDTLAKEQAGPLAAGGYDSCLVTATETGIYEVEFRAPDVKGNPQNKLAVNELFPIDGSQKKAVAAWDVTVFDPASNSEQKGRAYANYLPLHMAKAGAALYARPFVLSDTGYLYRVDLNGSDPWQFMFFANNKGFQDSNGDPLFQSVNANSAIVHDPSAADTQGNVTHKLFFNPPDANLPSTAPTPGGDETWLLSDQPALPQVSEFMFTGSEGTPNQAGTAPLKGDFSFKTDTRGSFILTIDSNQNNIYGDGNDRVMTGLAVVGQNNVEWDGLDGNSEPLPPQALPYGARLSLIVDDVHFPFLDVENNAHGIIVQRLNRANPTQVENSTVYYNNQGLTGSGQPQPISATAGVDSSTGAQVFTDDFGNNKGIDTWTSIAKPLELEDGILIKEADLSVVKTHSPENPVVGGPLTYTITVNNGGPSDVTDVQVVDTFPAGINVSNWTCQVNPTNAAKNSCTPASGSGDINTTVNLETSGVATLTVHATISSSLAPDATITNSVTITRPDDVTNPKSDGTGDTRSETAEDSLTLTPPDAPIVENIITEGTTPETPMPLPSLQGTDPTGGTITTYTIETLPPTHQGTLYLGVPAAGGQPISVDQALTPNEIDNLYFQPAAGSSGNAEFTYTATNDQNKTSDPATVTIPIVATSQNQAPNTQNDNATTQMDTPVTLPLLSQLSDPDNNLAPESLNIKTPPANGQVVINPDGSVTYTPAAGFSGVDSFTYEICDTEGLCSTATMVVTISADSDTPAPDKKILSLSVAGSGSVESIPAAIECRQQGGECVALLDTGTPVELVPKPAPGFQFSHWEGDCTTNNGRVVMTADKTCKAHFEPLPAQTTTLTVTVEGQGKVNSQPSGIACGLEQQQCADVGAVDRAITLNPVAEPGWQFEGWGGHCDSKGHVVLSTDKQCQAIFVPTDEPRFDLTVDKQGQGTVTTQPSGINCGDDCINNYANGTQVKLTALARPGFSFIGWSGDCSGTGNSVTVTMDAAKNCVATFAPLPEGTHAFTLITSGEGKVTSRVAGINCGDDCSENYVEGSTVELTALPEPGFSFVGWDGDCQGEANPLVVTIDQAKTCEALFAPTDDEDGVPAPLEAAAPNQGDGNNDGIADNQQAQVVSLPTPDGQQYMTVAVNEQCTISAIQFHEPPPATEDMCTHPTLLDLALNCTEAEVTIYYHGVSRLGDNPYQQYVPPTPGTTQDPQWLALEVTQSTVQLDTQTVPTVTFNLTDGALGDYSGVDGEIIHTSGRSLCPGQIQWSAENYTVNEFGNVATITVSRVGGRDGRISVDYATQAGNATEDEDYLSTLGTLVWEDGDDSDKTFTVDIKNDALSEGNETLTLLLSNPTGGSTVPEATELTIVDDETPQQTTPTCPNVSSCQTLSSNCCLSPCATCGSSGAQIAALKATIEVGQTLEMTLVEGQGSLSIKELPASTFVTVDGWRPLGNGIAEVALTGVHVGETQMVINDRVNSIVTLYINVVEAEAMFGAHTLTTEIEVGQTLDMTIGGGQGKLVIEELPDSHFVSLDNLIPLGNGVGQVSLTGVSVGQSRLILSDSATPPQKTTINIKVVSGYGFNGNLLGDIAHPLCDANAIGVNALGQTIETQTCFKGQLNLLEEQPPNDTMFTEHEAEQLRVSAHAIVDPEHIGLAADILLVSVHTTLTDERRYTRTQQEWILWDDQIASLPALQKLEALPETLDIAIPESNLTRSAGEWTHFAGYRLADGRVIHNGAQPLHFYMGNAASINLHADTAKTPTSYEVHTTSFFEPFVYNYEGRLGNGLTFEVDDTLYVSSFLRVDNWHVGKMADILIVATRRDALEQTTFYYDGQQWQQGLGQLEHLQAARRYSLPATLEIPVDIVPLRQGPGEAYTVFVGYRLDNVIVFNGMQPIHFKIAE
ncbi:MAG: Ig-like domain-containing protein [Pseudomonadota bacterium]|nr:Ig-like domain-containing protein [Pseudomonadota bacterium]